MCLCRLILIRLHFQRWFSVIVVSNFDPKSIAFLLYFIIEWPLQLTFMYFHQLNVRFLWSVLGSVRRHIFVSHTVFQVLNWNLLSVSTYIWTCACANVMTLLRFVQELTSLELVIFFSVLLLKTCLAYPGPWNFRQVFAHDPRRCSICPSYIRWFLFYFLGNFFWKSGETLILYLYTKKKVLQHQKYLAIKVLIIKP